MDAVFLKILNMGITASWLILAVIAARLLLRRAPKGVPCALWAFVAIRLACPISLESALSLIPSAETISPEILYMQSPTIHSGIPIVNQVVNPVISEALAPAAGASVNPLQIWTTAAAYLWLAGAAAMLAYAIFSYLRVRSKVREGTPLQGNIWLCDHTDTPFILGILRPRIYLPSEMDAAQRHYVLAHETAHLKRRDHWWKPLGFALLSVYWFHPLCWLAYWLLCRDIEMACDEKVIRDWDAPEKKAYSEALLACSAPRRSISACPLAFGEVGVKKRVKGVLHYKKPAFWILLAAAALCVVVAVCFLTNPRASRTFPLDGSNLAELDPQGITGRIAEIARLDDPAYLNLTADSQQLWLTPDFDLADPGVIQFFYTKQRQTFCAQLQLDAKENTASVTERIKWPEQAQLFKLQHYLEALRYLPQAAIRQLSPDADRYAVRLLADGAPEDYQRTVTYTANGAGSIDGWYIHLEVSPLHAVDGAYHGTGEEVLQLFYGSADLGGLSLTVPDTLSLSEYSAEIGWAGGWCLLPEAYPVYETASSVTPPWQRASGAVVSFRAEQVLSWDGETIAGINVYANHTLVEALEPVSGLCAPAYLARVTYDLYTAADLEALARQGISIDDKDAVSEYWCLYFARPGEETGYMLSLDARQFSLDDLRSLGASFDYPAPRVVPGGELLYTYVYEGDTILHTAAVSLYDSGEFLFAFSPLSSYIGYGTYTIEHNRLTLQAEDGRFVYVLDITDDGLVFDGGASSANTWNSGITDGAVLRAE